MFEQTFKNIDDVLWKEAGCTTELDYTEQTSWLLFLKYLDGLEQDRADEAALLGKQKTRVTFLLIVFREGLMPEGPRTYGKVTLVQMMYQYIQR